MIFELVYTSAPTGLFVGNTGFSVVGCTKNMDMAICRQLENLSAYTPLYPHYDSRAGDNPVNFAHRIISVSGRQYHVLSRICFNGLDYTQRSNKLASHLAISQEETPALPSGPACVFFQEGLFKDEKWEIKTAYFDFPPVVIDLMRGLDVCKTWQQESGDAGWAGVIAESFISNPQRNVYVVFDPERSAQNIHLIAEILSLLPQHMRWQITFSTYFTELPAGVSCNLRFCLPSCEALSTAKQNPSANLIVDLCSKLPPATGGNLVTTARTGKEVIPEMAGGNPFIVPQIPQQYVPVQQNLAPSNSGAKIAAYALLFALVIVGSLFIVFKRSDSNKIKSLSKDIAQNRKLMEQALSLTGRSLLVRVQNLEQAAYRMPNVSDISAQRDEVSAFVKKYEIASKKSKDKNFGVKDAQKYYERLNKLLKKHFQLIEQLHRRESFAQIEKTLVDDIAEYQATLESSALGEKVQPPYDTIKYTPRADRAMIKAVLTMANTNIDQIKESQSLLRKKFPHVKFPVMKDPLPNHIAVAQAPSQRSALFRALNQRKPYTVSFSDLLPGAEIKAVYWGKDSMKNTRGIYSISAKGTTIELKVDLTKGLLKISRMDKGKNGIPAGEFSIQVIKGNDSQWIEFFLTGQAKVGASVQLSLVATTKGFYVKYPVPKDLQENPDTLKDIVAVLTYGDKKAPLTLHDGKVWKSDLLPLPSTKLDPLLLLRERLTTIRNQFRSNMQKKYFSPAIEKLDAFTIYDKSPKSEDDLELLIDAALSSITIDKLGVVPKGILAKYLKQTLPEAMATIENEICKVIQSALGAVCVTLETHSKSWTQQVTIKNFKRGDE